MKLSFVAKYHGDKDLGASKKVVSQVSSMVKIGMNARLVLIDFTGKDRPSEEFIENHDIAHPNSGPYALRRIAREIESEKVMREVIRESKDGDIVYYRHPFSQFYYPGHFSHMARKCKLVIELQSIGIKEADVSQPLLRMRYGGGPIGNEIAVGHVDGIVGVTNEITEYYASISGAVPKPSITIPNGINTASVKLRSPPSFEGRDLNLLAVASVRYWHGLDRLLRGISEYSGDEMIRLDIVGDGSEIGGLSRMVKELGIEDNVFFHGVLGGDALDDLFNRAHLAIGILGGHRRNFDETCSLKDREYCARGVPFVDATIDPDFPADFEFAIRVPADESAIDLHELIRFAERVSNHDCHVAMRNYAVNNLDWTFKMRKLKRFVEGLVSQ